MSRKVRQGREKCKCGENEIFLGVNPDPARWDGQLLPFQVRDLDKITREVFQTNRPKKSVTMAKATLNTGETMYAVNDIFIGPRSHISARYSISIGGKTENQSSSGVIVSTGVGSTGWLKSLLAGAAGVVQGLPHVKSRLTFCQKLKMSRHAPL